MRQEDINSLNEPYTELQKDLVDRRFHSSIAADIPSATKLAQEILHDLDTLSFGISWWAYLPTEERILISDYLYQCVYGLEVNLVEAKLHYLEWLDAKEKGNENIANAVVLDRSGRIQVTMPSPTRPIDNLTNKLERMHICGFFQAIGSALDCLGASIIGVLGLPTSLRRSDFKKAEETLLNINDDGSAGINLQLNFKSFFDDVKKTCGPEDWLVWADQYRNMFIHRGRRAAFHQLVPRETILFDASNQIIPRATSTIHLAKFPDRSEIEGLIKSKDFLLNEDAEITLNGIFKSCRDLEEYVCEQLLVIWQERRNAPSLIEQPIKQWDIKIKTCNFPGYKQNSAEVGGDLMVTNPIIPHRMRAASVDDDQRSFWDDSRWNQ